MKTVRMLLTIALLAVAGVAVANNYEIHVQDDVVIGEDNGVVAEQGVPAPSVESYGVMPSWSTGCCERQPSKADHLWDNYCFEKHSGCCKSRCFGKTFCGTGPFAKDCCCESKCGPKRHLPNLHVLGHCKRKLKNCCRKAKSCCQKSHGCKTTECCQKAPCQKAKPCCQKAPCQKASCCKETKCCKTSKRCHKPLLSKLHLFRRCRHGKCEKGKGATVVGTSTHHGNTIPTPAVDGESLEMPSDVPPAPSIEDPAA